MTMHGAVQDTQPPRGHQGSIPSDILHFLIVKKDPTFIEINKKVKQKDYFFALFIILGGQLGSQVLTIPPSLRCCRAGRGKYLSVSG